MEKLSLIKVTNVASPLKKPKSKIPYQPIDQFKSSNKKSHAKRLEDINPGKMIGKLKDECRHFANLNMKTRSEILRVNTASEKVKQEWLELEEKYR